MSAIHLINNIVQLHEYGLYTRRLSHHTNLTYEAPVHLLSPTIGRGEVGAYSFVDGNGKFRNVKFGSFCSVSHDVFCFT